ncbi:hypothetical protein JWG42_09650 [Desulfoprunum benzoelyticum]|uniref:Putative CHY-type Zn-finger protein n=1 Tax=Desulfoprunum benzoelyticum TaxID=1506996 RepID=A0A840V2P6_9BACT|nr:hypothetical protein [Desulfoprunum benzoelyticum]MBB5347999.1 putative CHY-type Zn-finger protein [Desulfoprunum benzoelyticum]MBM9530412.1 hypothetical protein [Desulfoprunum benzoelyticum]
MTDQQHCPGFESNKSLSAIKVACPACKAEMELFSDEIDKQVTCPKCKVSFDPKTCKVEGK